MVLICFAAPVALPVSVLLALYIKLVSPGPILFAQDRVGYRRKEFRMLKFRTMRPDADPTVHESHLGQLMGSNRPMLKLDSGDPRLVPLGRWIRAIGLDELPQLWNVVRGDMSLVGPRPCTSYEFGRYTNRDKERFEVLPGLTGLWQVSGKNQTTFQEMIDLDVRYARSQSVWLDLQIILRTVPAVLMQLATECRTSMGATETSTPGTDAAPAGGATRTYHEPAERLAGGERLLQTPPRQEA